MKRGIVYVMRWLLVLPVAQLAFFGSTYLLIGLNSIISLPQILNSVLCFSFMGFALVGSAAAMAPEYKFRTALITSMLVIFYALYTFYLTFYESAADFSFEKSLWYFPMAGAAIALWLVKKYEMKKLKKKESFSV